MAAKHKLKMGDQVLTPEGQGEVIGLPVGKSDLFTVLRVDGRAAVYAPSQLESSDAADGGQLRPRRQKEVKKA
ncbi:MAG: hypothetical protein D6706_02125 [Chloroflexi bacterium]|nr:MAG: hypothetical protein D6706_02125 [Chloroflexota bacterium]